MQIDSFGVCLSSRHPGPRGVWKVELGLQLPPLFPVANTGVTDRLRGLLAKLLGKKKRDTDNQSTYVPKLIITFFILSFLPFSALKLYPGGPGGI